MSRISELIVKIKGDTGSLNTALGKVNTDLARAFSGADRASIGFQKLGSTLQSIGTTGLISLTAPLTALGGLAINAAADLEALKLGLQAVNKSGETVSQQFEKLREVAKLPGLGLQEAVRGSVNLQAIGFSAERSRNILLQFGNALASVGRGRADLDEVIRQLGQLASRGKVTADNLKPIIERVPQVASIIKREFGTIDSEALQKMGISAEVLIQTLEKELGQLPRVTGGLKNDIENLRDSITIAFGDAGAALAPFAKQFIDDFAVPAIGKVSELAKQFQALSPETKNLAVGLGLVAVGAPVVITALGVLISNATVLIGAFKGLSASSGALAIALNALPWVAVANGVYQIGKAVYDYRAAVGDSKKAQDEYNESLHRTVTLLNQQGVPGVKELQKRFLEGRVSQDDFARGLRELAVKHGEHVVGMKLGADGLKGFREEVDRTAAAAKSFAAGNHFAGQTFEARVLAEMLSILNRENAELVRQEAEARLGLRGVESAFKDLPPQIEENIGRMKDFGNGISVVEEAMVRLRKEMKQALPPVSVSKDAIKIGVEISKENQKQLEEDMKKAEQSARRYGRQVSLVANDLARNITDLITKGGKLKDVMVSTFSEIGKALLRAAIEKQFERLIGLAVEFASKIPGIGRAISSVFGTGVSAGASAAGGAASAAGGIAGAAGSVAGSAGSAASGVAGAVSSGITGWVGAISSAVTAVSSVIGNFQMAGMNKSLDLIEHETRFSQIHLLHILEKLNAHLPFLNSIHDRLVTVVTQGVGVYNAPQDAGLRLQGQAGGSGVNLTFSNCTFGSGLTQQAVSTMMETAVRHARLAGATI